MIETERLLLRRWRGSDVAPYAALNADAEVMRYFPESMWLDAAGSKAQVERFDRRFDDLGFGLYALERRDTGAFIGFTGLNPMPDRVPGAGGVEVGWRLAREAWGHGFATEAARASVAHGFGTLGLTEIWSMTAVLNTPSQAVMRRLGMVQHARFDHPEVVLGHPLRPHVVYRLAAP